MDSGIFERNRQKTKLTRFPWMFASLARVAGLIRRMGLENMGMPYVRHLRGKLWEMRGRGKDGIARSLYVTVKERRIVIVRSFVKETQRAPQDDVNIALKRAREIR